jgi:hypothetical protein
MANSNVRRYMGNIEVEDRVEGDPSKGSRFIVSLPGRDVEKGMI